MRVLDIGCGWGEALKFSAERYGVSGVGVTISQEQAAFARELCAGLPVEIRVQDYRELDERFDRIFSVGMFEHVGFRNYRRFFEVSRRCLDESAVRSEEHTSELQSLMRISYAVFCLKKKIKTRVKEQ